MSEQSAALVSCAVIGGFTPAVNEPSMIASSMPVDVQVNSSMDYSSHGPTEDSVRLEGARKRSADQAITPCITGKKPARDSL